jgi:hypothetical protein
VLTRSHALKTFNRLPRKTILLTYGRAPMVSFGTLAVITLAGLLGPLLGASRRIVIPVVVGELLAGVALGKSGAGLIDAGNAFSATSGLRS